jgi:hypothetical protein
VYPVSTVSSSPGLNGHGVIGPPHLDWSRIPSEIQAAKHDRQSYGAGGPSQESHPEQPLHILSSHRIGVAGLAK